MAEYRVVVLLHTSTEKHFNSKQTIEENVKAASVDIEAGAYVFVNDKGEFVAGYPVCSTVVKLLIK